MHGRDITSAKLIWTPLLATSSIKVSLSTTIQWEEYITTYHIGPNVHTPFLLFVKEIIPHHKLRLTTQL
jgi:hypothetical protein